LPYLKHVLSLLAVLAAAVSWVAVASAAPVPSSVTVLAKDAGVSFKANKYIQDNMAFSPGTVTVKSGGSLTFKFGGMKSMEPHTLTIMKQSEMPKTGAQIENCTACQRYATPHLQNPEAPPGESNPIVHWTIDKGKPGLDTVGDSIAIQNPGQQSHITVKVTAAAGATLYFLCAVHPWMQGKIIVK
jgi:plastocyanin